MSEGGAFPVVRPRRLRRTGPLRRLSSQVRLAPAELVLPLFVKEGIDAPQPIASMPRVMPHPPEALGKAAVGGGGGGGGGPSPFGDPPPQGAPRPGAER